MFTSPPPSVAANDYPSRSNPPETPRSRRHGAPAGPWPWVDFDHVGHAHPPDDQISPSHPQKWEDYPKSLFRNWGLVQVEKSLIAEAVKSTGECVIRSIDMKNETPFIACPIDKIKSGEETRFWEKHDPSRRSNSIRVQALFLDQPTGPVLQIIGTRYKIEPFFFSSALNRIPSRYQEQDSDGSDHITVTLPFIKINKTCSGCDLTNPCDPEKPHDSTKPRNRRPFPSNALVVGKESYLIQELLAIHMVRSQHGSTIISYHPRITANAGAAEHLRNRILDAGFSVYWGNILNNTKDSTLILLLYFWYALYAWDEALEKLYEFIGELETQTIHAPTDTEFNKDSAKTLHNVHAHLLSYTSLLKDFEKSVRFVLKTPNPVRDERTRIQENERMEKECENLLSEIERLEMGRHTHTERLKNAMALLFSTVNIDDSRQMQELTSLAVLDSRSMRQVSLLTMVFLPASFAATIFGMNLKDFDDSPNIRGTLDHYLVTAIPLTAFTIWIVLASQKKAPGTDKSIEGWRKLVWPFHVLKNTKEFFFPPKVKQNLSEV